MSEELSALIEKIRAQGVAEARAEAARILEDARAEADRLRREGSAEAEALRQGARKDADEYAANGRRTLEQAGRDLLLIVGNAIENILNELAHEAVDEAMTPEVVREMLGRMAQACVTKEDGTRLEFVVAPGDKARLAAYFADLYRKKLTKGLVLRDDPGILKGFRVAFVDDHVFLDFTADAVADALAELLRPDLAEVMRGAARIRSGIEDACKALGYAPPRSGA